MTKKLETSKSSNIARIAYDPITSELFVEFKAGGNYKYFNVPEEVYTKFTEAESFGKHFYSNIKGKYEFTRIN